MFNQITVIVIQNRSIKVSKIIHFGLKLKRDFYPFPVQLLCTYGSTGYSKLHQHNKVTPNVDDIDVGDKKVTNVTIVFLKFLSMIEMHTNLPAFVGKTVNGVNNHVNPTVFNSYQ